MIAALLPWIQAALGIASLAQTLQGPKQAATPPVPEKPPTLSWDEARQRAQESMNPIYDEQLENTLKNVDQELIARGFFGQLPGAVLSGARATDVERARASQIASLAAQMQGQSEQNALAQQQLAAQWALNQGQLAQQQWGQKMQGIGNLFNTALQYPLQHAQTWGYGLDGTPTLDTKLKLKEQYEQNQLASGLGVLTNTPSNYSKYGLTGTSGSPHKLTLNQNIVNPY